MDRRDVTCYVSLQPRMPLASRRSPTYVAPQAETSQATSLRLLAVQLDDQLFVDRQLNIFALRQTQDTRFVIVPVHFQPGGHGSVTGEFLGQFEHRQLLAVLADGNLLARAYFIRRNVDFAGVYGNVPVTHQLAPRLREAQAVDHVIQTAFQLLQQQLAGDAFGARSLLEVVAKLTFLREVDALGFLFFAQLQAVAYDFRLAVFPVLSGGEVALLDGTLIAEALCAFEEQLHALAAA